MRDKLIQVIRQAEEEFTGLIMHGKFDNPDDIPSREAMIADKLIEDGWVRLPCQEKDEFFILEKTQDGTQVTKLIVRFVSIYKNRFEIYCDTEARDGGYHFEPCRIGEDIYYTKEEAEQALIDGE